MVLYNPLVASMRTQVYLTADQRKRLDELTKREGKSLAQLIREAVDGYLEEESKRVDVDEILRSTFGIAPDFEVPPRRWGRDVWAEVENDD